MQEITQGALHLAMQITGSQEDARDILQDAIIKSLAHRNAPKPGEAGYKAWFYRVVHNQAIDWLRSRKKFVDVPSPPEMLSEDQEPGALLDQERRKLLLQKALNSLSAEQREIICLKDFHDFSYDDIANIMSLEKGTVMSRLHRARVALKNALVELNIFSGADNEL